jgi:hypothetical protein
MFGQFAWLPEFPLDGVVVELPEELFELPEELLELPEPLVWAYAIAAPPPTSDAVSAPATRLFRSSPFIRHHLPSPCGTQTAFKRTAAKSRVRPDDVS